MRALFLVAKGHLAVSSQGKESRWDGEKGRGRRVMGGSKEQRMEGKRKKEEREGERGEKKVKGREGGEGEKERFFSSYKTTFLLD